MEGSSGHRLDTLKARRLSGGWSVELLAKKATLSCREIEEVESGDTCRPEVTQRLLDALASPVAVTSSSVANPSTITVASHTFVTGDTVAITGHSGSTPSINASHVVTVVNSTSFTIPVNVTGGGTGGTATLDPASVGIARL